ncbi:hypothetical protein THAOC_22218 [Thalassiosira oceanica]|uniref:Uncharacterized protein n=1 Tax=Thalassiosira oceanica TaxID=159749 RepID=K0SGS9_THAOC|nr:hypothetical protein THAOC_22218 [Thalassiosira oceanica]|eukprot:EJK57707.1 hypothetical protein THAOC_22218 [Thalassiosira oceanica]
MTWFGNWSPGRVRAHIPFDEPIQIEIRYIADMKFLIASVAAASLLLSALPRGASAIRDHQFSEQVKAAMRSSLSFDCCQTAGDCPPKYKLFGKTGGGNTLCQVDKPVTDCSAMSTDDCSTSRVTVERTRILLWKGIGIGVDKVVE